MAKTKNPNPQRKLVGDKCPRSTYLDPFPAKKKSTSSISKPKRLRPGQGALRQIRKYQGTTNHLVPRLAFQRLVREILQETSIRRIQTSALLALQEATEAYLVSLYQDSALCTAHAKRMELKRSDMKLALRLTQKQYP